MLRERVVELWEEAMISGFRPTRLLVPLVQYRQLVSELPTGCEQRYWGMTIIAANVGLMQVRVDPIAGFEVVRR